jgi:hypothetical protein
MRRIYDPDVHCGARTRRDDPDNPGEKLLCTKAKGEGTTHLGQGRCKFHGGASPWAIIKGGEALARQQAEAAVQRFGLPRQVDPATALLEEVWRTAGAVDWLRGQIDALEGDESLVRGTALVRRMDGPNGTTITTEVQPGVNLWLDLYQKERRHLANVCSQALAAGVAERQVRLAERQGEMVGALVRGLLDDLGLEGPQRDRALEAARKRFTLMAGNG